MNEVDEKKLEEYQECFRYFDRDKDEKINFEDLETAMRSLGQNPTNAELLDILEELKSNNYKDIDFKCFLAIIVRTQATQNTEEEIKEAFRVFDKDGDGFISTLELKHVMASLGEKLSEVEVEEMLREADADGDGQINYDEFVQMMTA